MLRRATEAAGGEWADVAHLSEAELADVVRGDGVQILVELTGHTANNRLGVCALRPAPVQVPGRRERTLGIGVTSGGALGAVNPNTRRAWPPQVVASRSAQSRDL